MKAEILQKLINAILDGEETLAPKIAQEALDAGIPALEVLEQGAAKGLDILGERFVSGEAFLPELMLAGDAMSGILEVLSTTLTEQNKEQTRQGKVVIGTACGDIHDIGKNLVGAMLAVAGFEVHDLGIDVQPKDFVQKAKEVGATIIATSTLLTTSLPYLQDIVQYLQDAGIRDKYFYVVGGGSVTADWVRMSGADGFGYNVNDAVEVCKRLVKIDQQPGTVEPVILEHFQK